MELLCLMMNLIFNGCSKNVFRYKLKTRFLSKQVLKTLEKTFRFLNVALGGVIGFKQEY